MGRWDAGINIDQRCRTATNSLCVGKPEKVFKMKRVLMRFRVSGKGIYYFLGVSFLMASWGCASRNPQLNLKPTIDYKKTMARQKAELAEEKAALQKLPAKTAEGFEKSG
jgi:hypothetical protein